MGEWEVRRGSKLWENGTLQLKDLSLLSGKFTLFCLP